MRILPGAVQAPYARKILAACLAAAAFGCLYARAGQSVVAIHDSELTRALETVPATNPTPTGPGTTGYQWWVTNWHYFVMPDALKEMLRSDGTAFTTVSDANITAGNLLDSNGLPNYPIVFSLASEAISDSEIAPLTNYVAAGGFLFIGSSSFTRTTNGLGRGDFAIANAMGLHMATASLSNWLFDSTLTVNSEHRIVSQIPQGTVFWQMPLASDEISWPEANHVTDPPSTLPHLLWRVRAAGATVLAQGDSSPYLAIMPYGKGWIIYDAAMQPVLGHGGWAPGMYAYTILRNSIQWAYQCRNQAVPKLSPWPYNYDAAVVFRHDMEAIPSYINSIEVSAQYEAARGAAGDYFFCTGELRLDMTNVPATVASLQIAISNYNATIGSHNGGLTNINTYVPALTSNSYDYWHWGPDEVLDQNPPGYANGAAYALASISNSMNDLAGWGLTNPAGITSWVAPYFNATREPSLQLQSQLGVQVAGDTKIGPFPHFTLSTQTPDFRYGIVQMPVSDWFTSTLIGQAMEDNHTFATVDAMVDFYYNLGALINLYSHSSSDGSGPAGAVASEYVNHSLAKPRIWSANFNGVYNWWTNRANAQIVASYSTNATQAITTIAISGATDPNTAVEAYLPSASCYGLQVFTNGVLASGGFRTNGQVVKVLVGTSVTNAQICYSLPPTAVGDVLTIDQDDTLTVPAPGVIGNDLPGTSGTNLTPTNLAGPASGVLTLYTDGGVTYTPNSGYFGVDAFSYEDLDNVTNSTAAIATIDVVPDGAQFYDNLSRPNPSAPLAPWTQQLGAWAITNNLMTGTSSNNTYGYAWFQPATNWSNYAVQARVQFPAGAFGGGIGGRLDPTTGAHYAAWLYPEGSPGGGPALRLVKFEGWTTWSFNPMQSVSLGSVGTNFHTLTMAFNGSTITIYLDGVQKINTTDNNFDSVAPFFAGGITSDLYTQSNAIIKSMDDVIVATNNAPLVMLPPTNVTANAGSSATFSVTALGPSLNYQWFKGATRITGATNSSVTLTNLFGASNGNYSVTISNSVAVATSPPAVLTVIDPIITTEPLSRTNDAGTTGTFGVATVGTSPTYRWYKNGAKLSNGGHISGATTTNLTITGALAADAGSYTVLVTNSYGMVTSTPPAVLTVIDPFISGEPASRTNNAGTAASFTVTAAGTTTLNYHWFKNGLLLNNGGNVSDATSSNLNLSSVFGADAAAYTVVVSNSVGTVTSAPPAQLTVIDPIITSPPASRTNNAGTGASFSVTAAGTTPFGYSWYKNGLLLNNGGNVSGTTTSNLNLSSVFGADAAAYTVVVSNNVGTVTSAPPAQLTVNDPFITAEPASRTNAAGTTATFTVAAIGTASLNYYWFKNSGLLTDGGNVSGSGTYLLTLSNVLAGDAAAYTVTVSNSFGAVTSAPPAMLVVADPTITGVPGNRTNNAGTASTFTVTAVGTPPLVYQWIQNGTNAFTDGGNITGSTTAALTISNVLGGYAGGYTVIVSNSLGASVTSAPPAMFTVIDPIITIQPSSLTNQAGTPATFTVGAYGTAPNYQWLKGVSPVTGATNSSYTIPAVSNSDAGTYSVVVSNFFGSVTSSNAVLTVASQIVIDSITVSNNVATITWETVAGDTYRLQYLGDLTTTNWTAVVPDVTATSTTASATNDGTADQRYYRIMLVQ